MLRVKDTTGLRAAKRLGLLLSLSLLVVLHAGFMVPAPAKPSQLQVARQFLIVLLQRQYKQAYQLLAPEVNAAISLRQFEAATQPLIEQSQRRGQAIDLYKLGMRISDGPVTRYFYNFSFKSDTLQAKPTVLLDVSFRDSTATRVLSFGLIPAPQRKLK
ncbi:hypothetical protein [Hymenobacter sp. GOD-10R]|uniref:hypothetical protein n=1 Tax=Hymenobacter sp. GOD-10R TaxID=3093922 RepID=UPI002D781055|nr:hypothetical protein [Hymenobacter sp. GOD-10R]WRQ29441.1 hypothetical protein SD425_04105 [Hymenobacter sp. GOD-10R]